MKNYIFGIANYSDGTSKISRNFTSSEAFSRWANKQFEQDHSVTVYEYEMDRKTFGIKETSTWHE